MAPVDRMAGVNTTNPASVASTGPISGFGGSLTALGLTGTHGWSSEEVSLLGPSVASVKVIPSDEDPQAIEL